MYNKENQENRKEKKVKQKQIKHNWTEEEQKKFEDALEKFGSKSKKL